MKDSALQGSHAKGDAGVTCGGKVNDGSCKGCGADNLAPKDVKGK